MRRNPAHSLHGKGTGSKREDVWFSRCIRHRDNWRCRNCGKDFIVDQAHLQCAHIYGRANKATRWEPGNCIALCHKCHGQYTREPVDWFRFCEELLGREHMDRLLIKKNVILKTNQALRKQISDHYRLEYHRMREEQSTDLRAWDEPVTAIDHSQG